VADAEYQETKQKQGLFLAYLVYGTLCRVKETASFFGCFFAWRLADSIRKLRKRGE